MIKDLTKAEIKEQIIELNYYLLLAIDMGDEISMSEIKDRIGDLINLYINKK